MNLLESQNLLENIKRWQGEEKDDPIRSRLLLEMETTALKIGITILEPLEEREE